MITPKTESIARFHIFETFYTTLFLGHWIATMFCLYYLKLNMCIFYITPNRCAYLCTTSLPPNLVCQNWHLPIIPGHKVDSQLHRNEDRKESHHRLGSVAARDNALCLQMGEPKAKCYHY